MKAFSVSIIIAASAGKIWSILTDAPNWTRWNTTVEKIVGEIALGQKVSVFVKVNPKRAFPVRVTQFVPNKKMVWTGGMPLGLFKGERTYTLTEQPNGSTEFAMREEFTGLMAPLITRSIPDLQPVFQEFAAALKQHAEQPNQ